MYVCPSYKKSCICVKPTLVVYSFGKRKSHLGSWENFLKSKRACSATFACFNFDFGSVYISAMAM